MKRRGERRGVRVERELAPLMEGEFRVRVFQGLWRETLGVCWRKEGNGVDLLESDEQGNLILFAWGVTRGRCSVPGSCIYLSILGTLTARSSRPADVAFGTCGPSNFFTFNFDFINI